MRKDLQDLEVYKEAAADFGQQIGEAFNNSVPELNNELTETEHRLLNSAYNTVANGLTNGIKGLIDGTKSWGDVLGDIAGQLGSMFLQFGFKALGAGLGVPWLR